MNNIRNADGQPNQNYWERYSAIVVAIREAGLKHPHSADIHAYCNRTQMSVEQIVNDWGKDCLNH